MTTTTPTRTRGPRKPEAPAKEPEKEPAVTARWAEGRWLDVDLGWSLIEQARNATTAAPVYVPDVEAGRAEFLATVDAAVDAARAMRRDRAREYDRLEQAIRARHPVPEPIPGGCGDGPASFAVTGHEPVEGPAVTSPRVFSSELPEEDEARLEAVFGPNVRVLPASGEADGADSEPIEAAPHVAGDGDEPEEALDKGPLPEQGETTTPSGTYVLDGPQPEGGES